MNNRKEYPQEWFDTIRPAILKRDHYKCTVCGIKHRQWIATKKLMPNIRIDADEINDYRQNGYTVYRIYLHVCHKNNVKEDVREDNLITLCVTHHAKMDAPYKALLKKGSKIKRQLTIFDII